MKLLLVLESWGSGGTEQYVRTLYSELKRLEPNLVVNLILLKGGVPKDFLQVEKWCECATSADGNRYNYALKLACSKTTSGYNIYHLHLYTSLFPAAVVLRLLGRGNLVATFHSPIQQWHWRYRFVFRIAVKLCDVVIGASEYTAGQLRTWRSDTVTASPPTLINRPIPSSCTNRDHIQRSHQETDVFKIISVGRLSSEKSFKTLIAAVARLPEHLRSKIHVEIIGDGIQRTELQKQIDASNLSLLVRLIGRLSHDETVRRVAAANLFVLPSLFEGFGMAAAEAMALGVPTVTSDFPASNEYIDHGVTGHQFPIGDADALASLITWHINKPEASATIARAGQSLVQSRYHPKRIAQIHQEIYRSCLGKS